MTMQFGEAAADALHVMSMNIQRPSPLTWRRDSRWNVRRRRLRSLLHAHRPTVLGAQEVMPEQAAFVQRALGSAYQFVGRGRGAAGAGEGCPVFYDAERLEVIEWHQAALSDTPLVAGSRSWGNVFPRITVSVHFHDRSTGGAFRFINTHFEPLCRRSQMRSAATIRAEIAASPLPAIVTGDLNAGPGSPTTEALLAHGFLVDVWQTARERVSPEYATYARHRAPRRGRRIDWIITTPEIRVDQAMVNARQIFGGWPSDHLPVQAMVRVPRAAPESQPQERVNE